jgi:hypothetical protein
MHLPPCCWWQSGVVLRREHLLLECMALLLCLSTRTAGFISFYRLEVGHTAIVARHDIRIGVSVPCQSVVPAIRQ